MVLSGDEEELPPAPSAAGAQSSSAAPPVPRGDSPAPFAPPDTEKRGREEGEDGEAAAAAKAPRVEPDLHSSARALAAADTAFEDFEALGNAFKPKKKAGETERTKSEREASWMRAFLSEQLKNPFSLHSSPLPQLQFRSAPSKPTLMRRAPFAVERIARPVLFDQLTSGRTAVFVNLATEEHMQILRCFQLGGVPCNNQACAGKNDKWDTSPVNWNIVTGAPLIFVDERGAPNPMLVMKMRCNTCHPGNTGPTYSPLDMVVLKRLPDIMRDQVGACTHTHTPPPAHLLSIYPHPLSWSLASLWCTAPMGLAVALPRCLPPPDVDGHVRLRLDQAAGVKQSDREGADHLFEDV